MTVRIVCRVITLIIIGCSAGGDALAQPLSDTDRAELVRNSIKQLVAQQDDDGAWPYEGVYRVAGKIPLGYRIGGTAIVCQALMYADPDNDADSSSAIERGVSLILQELEDPLMKPSTDNRYDVRVWGHIYALDLFTRIKLGGRMSELNERTEPWIEKLISALVTEELDEGGWNYAGRRHHACFVTAPAVQALLLARQAGYEVPDEVFDRSVDVLQASRTTEGAFQYSGINGNSLLPGSIARNAICETTLVLLSEGNAENLQLAIDAFHEHWDELEKRRKKTGTHKPPYGVAPYYFYYGHRYLAQAIALLPGEQQALEYGRYQDALMRTRDEDNSWNDRVFDRSKSFGTAMAVLSLIQPDVPLPAALKP